MNKRYIFPECFLDQELLLLLGVTRKEINKATDIADVMKKFGQEVYRNSKAIGFVDLNETNSQPSRLQKFQDVREKDNLIWKQEMESKHILIVVRPRLEDWIYSVAYSAGMNPAQPPYHLPKSAKDLHDNITAKRSIKDNKRVMNFLKDVIERNPAPIQTLRMWIAEIQSL